MPRMCHHERCLLHQPAWPPEDPTFPALWCETQRTRRRTSAGKTDVQQAVIGRSRHLAVCPPANCPANQKVLNRDCPPGKMKSSGEKQETYLGITTVRLKRWKVMVRNNRLIWEWNIGLSEYLNAIRKGQICFFFFLLFLSFESAFIFVRRFCVLFVVLSMSILRWIIFLYVWRDVPAIHQIEVND